MSTPTFTGIHHINFTVSDLQRSATWYRDVLGLEAGWEMEDIEGRGQKVVLLVPDSPLRIVLTKHQGNDGAPASELATGLDHIALTVANHDVLRAWMDRFTEMGVDHSPIKEGATGWLITFRDPDNIQLEMYTVAK
jgi:catechol 2,3-dioxygenase-like lactoylglutathione lyase family enzyme